MARQSVEWPVPGAGRWPGRFAALAAGAGDGQDVVVDGGGAVAAVALGLVGAQPVEGALADQVSFHRTRCARMRRVAAWAPAAITPRSRGRAAGAALRRG